MKNTKKGFTIVELVVVISVIAILSAVLIPTFSTVIKRANASSALQEAKIAMDMVSLEENAGLKDGKYTVYGEKFYFEYNVDGGEGTFNEKEKDYASGATMASTVNGLPLTAGNKVYAKSISALNTLLTKNYAVTQNENVDVITIGEGESAVKVPFTDNSDISSKVIVVYSVS